MGNIDRWFEQKVGGDLVDKMTIDIPKKQLNDTLETKKKRGRKREK